jgi:hypothetical protein
VREIRWKKNFEWFTFGKYFSKFTRIRIRIRTGSGSVSGSAFVLNAGSESGSAYNQCGSETLVQAEFQKYVEINVLPEHISSLFR